MTTFYICRHGQTENNRNKLLSGWIDTPLTEDGKRDAVTTAAKLSGIHFDKIVSSDLGRTIATAKIIAEVIGYNSPLQTYPELREVNYGDFGNQPYSRPQSPYPDISRAENTNYTPPNGESLAQMQQRVMLCIENLGQMNPAKTILIVAHDGTINAVYSSFSGTPIGLVDADNHNAHDSTAEFNLEGNLIVSFEKF